MYSKRSIFSTLGLIALVGLTSWLSVRESTPPTDHSKTTIALSIANDITIHQMDKKGNLSYKAHATSATQFNNDKTYINNIAGQIISHGNNEPWNITANNGLITEQGSKITLSNNVLMSRAKNKYSAPIRFSTSQINLYPHHNYAQTAKSVTISEPGTKNTTTAIGMQANLKTKQLTLLSHVHSTYDSKNLGH